MLVALITQARYDTIRLPDRMEGRFLLRDPENGTPLFALQGLGDHWQIEETANGRLRSQETPVLRNGVLIQVSIRSGERAFLFAEEADNRYAKYARCPVPDRANFRIGTGAGNEIRCSSDLLDSRHCVLTIRDRVWTVEDCGSRMGTYVNGKRLRNGSSRLNPGDTVMLLNQKFIVLPGLLVFNAQYIVLDSVKTHLRPMHAFRIPEDQMILPGNPPRYFHREARFTSDLERLDLSVDAPPPAPGKQDEAPAYLTYGPAVTSGAAMLLGGMNPIMSIGMLASSILFPGLGRKRTRLLAQEAEQKRQEAYEDYLASLEKELKTLNLKQTELMRRQMPEPATEFRKILSDPRTLWSRRPEQKDFLGLRVGTGDIPMAASLSFPKEVAGAEDDPLKEALRTFRDRPRMLENVPIPLDLRRFYITGISGKSSLRQSFALQLIGQLTVHAGYDDLRLCLIGPMDGALSCLRWLPHTWNPEKDMHYTANTREEMNRLVPALDQLLTPHRRTSQGLVYVGETVLILISDSELAHAGVLTRLLMDASYTDVHVMILAEHGSQLPSRTDLAISLKEDQARMVWQEGTTRMHEDFRLDPPVDGVLPSLASLMANTILELQGESESMPRTVPFLDMFDVQDVHHLNILSRWEHADPIHTLGAPIGISEDGDLCSLDVHEKGDGPHGLIAGTTGSGKSELIMSFILSMAISYSPLDVTFALIDYKGGGMANAFADLPHTVGVITNLDGSALHRSLSSIESENIRRQTLFANTQKALGLAKMEIGDYQRLYREGKVSEPMPHLIILTDEFAELKTQEPEFMQKLISAARIGRSLGVHLVLATQQPAGVVDDQIMTNTNFRLCLRMSTPQDSQSILKTTDAAFLNHPGSFYKQVGTVMIRAQSGYTGADYTPEKALMPECSAEVLDHMGNVRKACEFSPGKHHKRETQALAVTRYIQELAEREQIHVRPLWVPLLEEKIPLSGLYARYPIAVEPWAPAAVLGEMDDPANQRRAPVRISLTSGKHTLIYGALGSGKAMALMTVLSDLVTHYTADALHIYILDYGDSGLALWKTAPHVGDVLLSDEDEKLQRLLNLIENEIARRRKVLGGMATDQPVSERMQAEGIPYLLLVLHHLSSVQEHLSDQLDRLLRIMKDGARWGITVLATQESASGLRIQLQDRFAVRYVLQMDHDDDYRTLLGRTNGMKPAGVQGRGLFREDQVLYEFQTAAADEDPSTLCRRIRDAWQGRCAASVPVMPDHVTPELLKAYLDPQYPLRIPVGLSTAQIEPVIYPWDSRNVHLVLGQEPDVHAFLHAVSGLAVRNGLDATFLEVTGDRAHSEKIADTVSRMFEQCRRMKSAGTTGEPSSVPQGLILIPSWQRIVQVLDEERQEMLRAMLEKARPVWGWTFVVGDAPQNLANIRYQENDRAWFSTSVCSTEGIYLGAGITSQNILQAGGDSHMLYQNVKFPLGYVIQNGTAQRVKLVCERREMHGQDSD